MQVRFRSVLETAAVFAITMFAVSASARDYVVVAHPDVAATRVNLKTLQAIFLGEKSEWEKGEKIMPVTLDGGAAHEAFVKDVLRKTPMQFSNYWNQQLFTGKGVPPRSFTTAEELMEYVAKTRGAVGYVPASVPLRQVKALEVLEQ
jgi:hypothetical protein